MSHAIIIVRELSDYVLDLLHHSKLKVPSQVTTPQI